MPERQLDIRNDIIVVIIADTEVFKMFNMYNNAQGIEYHAHTVYIVSQPLVVEKPITMFETPCTKPPFSPNQTPARKHFVYIIMTAFDLIRYRLHNPNHPNLQVQLSSSTQRYLLRFLNLLPRTIHQTTVLQILVREDCLMLH